MFIVPSSLQILPRTGGAKCVQDHALYKIFLAPEVRSVYSTKLSTESSSLRRCEMFIVPSSLQNLPRSGGAKCL